MHAVDVGRTAFSAGYACSKQLATDGISRSRGTPHHIDADA
jgi:hypothetical protein